MWFTSREQATRFTNDALRARLEREGRVVPILLPDGTLRSLPLGTPIEDAETGLSIRFVRQFDIDADREMNVTHDDLLRYYYSHCGPEQRSGLAISKLLDPTRWEHEDGWPFRLTVDDRIFLKVQRISPA